MKINAFSVIRSLRRVSLVVVCVLIAGRSTAQTGPSYLAGSLPKDEAQPVYSHDLRDPWNRLFHCLFTRALKVRLSDDFAEGAPFTFSDPSLVGKRKYSAGLFQRIESGDRAVDPLFPQEQFRDDVSTVQLLVDPRFSEFGKLLAEALAEQRSRPPLERALMQGDLWAVYDFLSQDVSGWILKDAPIPLYRERQAQLRKPLAQLIRKLALTPEEIKALPDNYAAAASALSLPDLFGPNSEWMEILSRPGREHERATHQRRVARVFIKPAKKPEDRLKFLQRVPAENIIPELESAALVVQNLLVNNLGEVVTSPLTCSVQLRVLAGEKQTVETRFLEFELSRKQILESPATGGLKKYASGMPAYMSGAGNDYSFAPPVAGSPILISNGSRCISCHGPEGRQFFSLSAGSNPSASGLRMLNPAENEHAPAVAKLKMSQASLKKLIEDWK
jgi:hypothetical protein